MSIRSTWFKRFTAVLLCIVLAMSLVGAFAEDDVYRALGSNVRIGDNVSFGSLNGNSISWTVLDISDNKALILSDKALYSCAFSANGDNVSWESSLVREWLNGEFVSSAFNDMEKSAIALTLTDNSDDMGNPIWTAFGWSDTVDYAFVLSYAEAVDYLGGNFRCEAASYMSAQGVQRSGNNVSWWLRAGGFSNVSAAGIDASGTCVSYRAADARCGVRPAMWVKLSVGPNDEPDDPQKIASTVKKVEKSYDYIMVLDVSGSMDREPIRDLKTAGKSLVDGIYEKSPKSQIEIIKYATNAQTALGFSGASSSANVKNTINGLSAYGNTNMVEALNLTKKNCENRYTQLKNSGKNMSTARICVIFMSDGIPTNELVDVYDAADSLHELSYVDVYCVGFFHAMSEADAKTCEGILRYIASDSTKMFIVGQGSDLELTLADIIDSVTSNPPMVVWIDFVGEVSVTYNGETLDKNHRRTSFGTLQLEGANDSVKVIRLNASLEFEILFTPNTDALIDITVWMPDINGEYTDIRALIGLKAHVGQAYKIEISISVVCVWAYDSDGNLIYYYLEAHVTITITVHYRPISWYTAQFLIKTSSYFSYNTAEVSGRCAFDGNLNTAWCEGANGDGVGEWIMATTLDGRKYTLSGVEIVTGYTKSDWHWDLNSRVAAFDLYVDDVFVERLELKDIKSRQYFTLSQPVSGSSFKFVIAAVYLGSEDITGKNKRLPDTLVTEIAFR